MDTRKRLEELYAELEKHDPGSEESKKIAEQILETVFSPSEQTVISTLHCPECGEEATYQDAMGTLWDSNAHHWQDRTGSTVHEPGCSCGFCKMGSTKF
jgi:hypothetical protein